jgi:hypothetical protein
MPPFVRCQEAIAAILFAGVVVILSLNVALILQNRTLKREIATPPSELPQVGTKINRLEGVGLDGSKMQVSFTGLFPGTCLDTFAPQGARSESRAQRSPVHSTR